MENYEEITIEKKNSFAEKHPNLFVAAVSVAGIAVSVGACIGGYYLVGKLIGKGFNKTANK